MLYLYIGFNRKIYMFRKNNPTSFIFITTKLLLIKVTCESKYIPPYFNAPGPTELFTRNCRHDVKVIILYHYLVNIA